MVVVGKEVPQRDLTRFEGLLNTAYIRELNSIIHSLYSSQQFPLLFFPLARLILMPLIVLDSKGINDNKRKGAREE